MVVQEFKDSRDTTSGRAGPKDPAMPFAETGSPRKLTAPQFLARFSRQSKVAQAVLALLALGAVYLLFALIFIAVAISGQQY
ncbi:MAG: hypothetical protein C4534_11280 [Gaiellales bacterium]|nr:MAG: hypothetical protein C4534_11280 [Gaiellales bacterium]